MDSLQQLLADLFGENVSFFSSLWDIIQGFLLFGGGIVAMIYRHRDTVSRAKVLLKSEEVETISKKLNTFQVSSSKELEQVKEVVTYMADMLVTLSLSSPVLLDKAKQQIAGYAQEIKQINGVELEPITQKIIEAVTKVEKATDVLKVETVKIEAKAEQLVQEVKKTEQTVEQIINSIPL